jgi:hypothetical protein
MSILASSLGVEPGRVAPILIFYFINIHHYFTDGVIWKISNPEVRRELFAHVETQRRNDAKTQRQDGMDGRTAGRQVGGGSKGKKSKKSRRG